MPDIGDDLVSFAEGLADAARAMLLERAVPASVDLKADRTFVTDLDVAIEARLRAAIGARYPAHGVLGEEADADRPDADWVWVLDPIDGTAAFVAGMPVYGTLIALAHRGAPVLGVIDFPATRERWVGVRGRATTLDGGPCRTRRGVPLARCIQSASNPDLFSAQERPALAALASRTAWRVYGGAALSYGRIACGRIDVAADAGLKIHDYAAFVPIIEGAGGRVTDWDGAPLRLGSGGRILAAGDPALHAQALAIVAEALAGDGRPGGAPAPRPAAASRI